MSTQTYRLLNLLLLAALFAGSMMVYPHLPRRFPIHFGVSGQPDGWATRSPLSWLMIPLVAAGTVLLLEVASRISVRNPHLWNVPDKPRFLTLTAEERAPIIHRLQNFMGLVGVMTTALMGVVQASIYHAATGRTPDLPAYFLPALVMYMVIVLGAALRLNRGIATLIRDAHGRRAAAS